MDEKRTRVRKVAAIAVLALLIGTLLSYFIITPIKDAKTRAMLGDPDAFVTDTARSPWIYADENGLITIYPEHMLSITELVIPDAVNGVKVTGKSPEHAFHAVTTARTIFFPKSFSASSPDGATGIFWFGKWNNLEVIVFEEGAGDLTGVAVYSMPALKAVYLPKSATGLYAWSFKECGENLTVYYAGTEEEWVALGTFAKNVSKKYEVVFNTPVPEY